MANLSADVPTIDAVDMPVIRPLPIRTRGVAWYVSYWRWLFYRRDFRLEEDFYCRMPTGQAILIRKGFVFDGASIPRVMPTLILVALLTLFSVSPWIIIPALVLALSLLPTGILLIPGLLHDYAYYHMALHGPTGDVVISYGSRREADQMFNEVNHVLNQMLFLTALCAVLLWAFAGRAWRKHRKRETTE